MAGYSRQSVADIIASAIIRAAPVNAEYNAIRDAFAFSGGHKHDGSSTEGAYVPLIADVDALNKAVVDTANNRISFYSEVGGAAVEQVRIQDGAIVPVTTNDIDLGTSSLKFKNLYVEGIGAIGSVTILGGTVDDAVIGGTTPAAITGTVVTGTSLVGPVTGNVTGDVTGNLTGNVTGDVTGDLTGDVTSTGTSTFATVDINGGNIDGTVIGATTPAASDFTTMDTTGDASVGGTFNVTGTSTFTGAMSAVSLTTTGNSTHATVDINGGAIDGTIIGASSAAAGSFTTISTSGQSTLASADINGGTIDGSVIGGTSPQAVTGTTITANTGFTGALTGNVTGNVTGNLTGNVTGDVTGDLTGNVTASSGTTTLNDLVVNGTVDFTSTALLNVSDPTAPQHAATKSYVDTADALKLNLAGGTMSGDITMGGNTVTGLGTPSASSDAATKGYVDTEVAALVDAAPGTLDTLNELAAALGDDPDFATTITDSIATKLPLAGGTMTGDVTLGANKATSTATPATDDTLTRKGYVDTQDALKLNLTGGTMSGAIAMGTSKITGLGDPTAAQDAVSKSYSDTQDATKLNLSGGTMTGNIVLGANKATSTATPTANDDLTRKGYVDGILGSATAAATSAANAATSETNAATSETNAGNSAAAAAASYDDFDDRYLGAKSSAPSVDNDGDALVTGALYWNSTSDELYVWDGSSWQQGSFTAGSLLANVLEDTTPQLGGDLDLNSHDITGTGNVGITGNITLSGTVDGRDVAVDGTKLDGIEAGADVTDATNVAAAGAAMETGADFTGDVTFAGNTSYGDNDKAIFGAGSDLQIYHDGSNSWIKDEGTGVLAITTNGNGIGFYDPTGTEPMLFATKDNAVDLYFNGAKKLATTSTGVDITGTLTSDGLTVENGVSRLTASYLAFSGQVSTPNEGAAIYRPVADTVAISTNTKQRFLVGSGGDISFYEDTGTTPKFFWDASAERLAVGGTTTNATLHVHGNSVISNGNFFSIQSSSGLSPELDEASNGWAFTTNGSERLRITSAGSVGIGTSSPPAKLTIAEDLNGPLDATAFRLNASSANDSNTLFGGPVSSGNYSFFQSYKEGTSAGVRALAINPAGGNVGIGTSSPAYPLDISDSANGIRLGSDVAGYRIFREPTGGNAGLLQFYASQSGYNGYIFGGADGERMRIDASGNFLVGMTSASTNNDGAGIRADGLIHGKRANVVATFNRKTSDGNIVEFARDNAVVGSIGTNASRFKVKSNSLALYLENESNKTLVWGNVSGVPYFYPQSDDDTNIGYPSQRFKDLYLSGSAYVGDKIIHDGDTNTYLGFGTDTVSLVTGGSGRLTANNLGVFIESALHEDYDALSGTTPSCDPNNGGAFSLTMTGNTTFTFGGTTSGYSTGFVLQLTGNGGTVTWPSSVDWAGGTAPDAPASGETDLLVFWTRDGGTTWYGALAIDAAA